MLLDVLLLSSGAAAIVRGKDPQVTGVIRFVGNTQFASGYWVGLELTGPSVGTGKNDGKVNGVEYFSCLPLNGLFVRPSLVLLQEDEGGFGSVSGGNASGNGSGNSNGLSHAFAQEIIQESAPRDDANKQFTDLVKSKLFNMMTLLNQQLELIEALEGDTVGSRGDLGVISREVLALTSQENEVNELFCLKLKSLMS